MPSPADLARPLAETLLAEESVLRRMETLVAQQLDAVRTRRTALLDGLTIDLGNAVAELHRLRAQRERQTRLATRVLHLDGDAASLGALVAAIAPLDAALAAELGALRSRVQTLAARARCQTDTLTFALQYASALGRDLVRVFQGAGNPSLASTYTRGGQNTAPAAANPFLNQMG